MIPLPEESLEILMIAYYDDSSRDALNADKRNDMKSALGRILDRAEPDWRSLPDPNGAIDPHAIPPLDTWLRDLRASCSSLKTIESKARSGVRLCGIDLPDGRGRPLLSAAWIAVRDRTEAELWRRLQSCPHWCSAEGIDWPFVDGNVLRLYEHHRAVGRDPKGARQQYLSVLDAVYELFKQFGIEAPPDMPARDYGTFRYRLPSDCWTMQLQMDVAIAADGLARWREPWAETHRNAPSRVAEDLYRDLSALYHVRNLDLSTVTSAKVLCEIDNARAVTGFNVERHDARKPTTHAAAAYQCARRLYKLAIHHDIAPDELEALRQLRLELAPPDLKELTADKQRVIFHFLKPENARALRQLPASIFRPVTEGARLADHDPRQQVAFALELGLSLGLWPQAIAGCLVVPEGVPPVPDAVAQILCDDSSGAYAVSIGRSRRGMAREFPLLGMTLNLFLQYAAQVEWRSDRCSPYPLFPGRDGWTRNPAALSREIAALITQRLSIRVTAGHLPAIAAALVISAPQGGREAARILLGRQFAEIDRLFDGIENQLALHQADRDLER